jgi:hypothetical protein
VTVRFLRSRTWGFALVAGALRECSFWRTPYGSNTVLKSPRDCIMLGASMRRVGLIDITVGNATRLGALQRSTTRRCASHHIATQRLSRWGSPAARARLARTVPRKRLWLRDGHVKRNTCRAEAQIHVPIIFTIGAAGQAPQQTRFLTTQVLVRRQTAGHTRRIQSC